MEDLIEAYLSVYEESDIKARAKAAVDHQRHGTHGDDDALEQSTKAVKKATKYPGRQGPITTPSLPESYDGFDEEYVELNRKRQNRMTDQTLRHMKRGSDDDWEKIYKIENERDTQTPEVSKAKSAANRNRPEAEKRSKAVNETIDLYDLVLDHLLDEGYADTEENAITIMANMSEEWIDEIIDEAQIMSVSDSGGNIKYRLPRGIDRIQTALQRLKDKKNETRNRAGKEENQRHTRNAIQQMNANPGTGSASADHGGAGDKTGRFYHYNLKDTDHIARRRRASGR